MILDFENLGYKKTLLDKLFYEKGENKFWNEAIVKAYYSFGSIFKQAAVDYIDIATEEIKFELQNDITDNSREYSRLYFYDDLPNGAGFVSFISDEKIFTEILIKFGQLENGNWNKNSLSYKYESEEHNCDVSCQECIKNYDNRFQHKYLNWRLGLDLLEIIQSGEINLGRWSNIKNKSYKILDKLSKGYQEVIADDSEEDFNLISYKKNALIIGHPFWYKTIKKDNNYNKIIEKLKSKDVKKIDYIDYVKIIENPSLLLSKLDN
tara:strand:- start:228 stop:1022 length:795 start_codon:yes stop_codon:yes gene_type:complete